MKKLFGLLITIVMVLGLSTGALAQNKASGFGGDATITINNAAKGETYRIVKLFDATITDPASDAIAYSGTVPAALSDYFEADAAGNVTLKRVADANGNEPGDDEYVETFYGMQAADFVAMKNWADGVPADDEDYPSVSETSDGSVLNFTGLTYGYYVIISSQGAAVTVDSTNKNVTVRDKNSKEPSASKDVTPSHASIGDTITYTATFDAPNYLENDTGAEPVSEPVVSYIIEDTLPDFLEEVTVTEVKVLQPEENPVTLDADDYQFTDKKIEIPWVVEETVPTTDHTYTSLYKNGSKIVITYTAKLTGSAKVGAGNENKVSLEPQVDRGNGKEPFTEDDEWEDTADVFTHAAALQKKADNENGADLAGAEFSFKGLVVSGVPGFYTVVSYDSSENAADGTIMKCDEHGKLVIAGIDADADTPIKLIGKETTAPNGYNLLGGTFELPTIVMTAGTTTTHGSRTTYYDSDGNIVDQQETGGTTITRTEITKLETIPAKSILHVVNRKGSELPSTGGMGTTLFYALGVLLVLVAGVALVTRRRMHR